MDERYLIDTEDGTRTLFMEEYGQAMHSVSGAYEESLLKHVIPSRILEKKYEKLSVLDIGFGLGYNVLALINEFTQRRNGSTLEIVSVERDKTLLPFMEKIHFHGELETIYSFIRKTYISGEGNYGTIKLRIIFNDAREILKTPGDVKFDAVFQDPFSPSKNPELWSIDYFKLLAGLIEDDGILTTYSSADHIRRAMFEAGFHVGKGPSVGKKREGTVASPVLTETELDIKERNMIFSNIKSLPYEDCGLSSSREEILSRRLKKIQELKAAVK